MVRAECRRSFGESSFGLDSCSVRRADGIGGMVRRALHTGEVESTSPVRGESEVTLPGDSPCSAFTIRTVVPVRVLRDPKRVISLRERVGNGDPRYQDGSFREPVRRL